MESSGEDVLRWFDQFQERLNSIEARVIIEAGHTQVRLRVVQGDGLWVMWAEETDEELDIVETTLWKALCRLVSFVGKPDAVLRD